MSSKRKHWSQALLGFLAAAAVGIPALAGDRPRVDEAAFCRLGEQVEALARAQGAEAALGEVAVARRWIEDGLLYARSGRMREAALLAERLEPELALIRALVEAGRARAAAAESEAALAGVEREIALLRARLVRLEQQREGRRLTDALPPAETGP